MPMLKDMLFEGMNQDLLLIEINILKILAQAYTNSTKHIYISIYPGNPKTGEK